MGIILSNSLFEIVSVFVFLALIELTLTSSAYPAHCCGDSRKAYTPSSVLYKTVLSVSTCFNAGDSTYFEFQIDDWKRVPIISLWEAVKLRSPWNSFFQKTGATHILKSAVKWTR